MSEVLVFTVDCFTDRPFAGNPNAVCLLDAGWPATQSLQRLAADLNLPASAFVRDDRRNTELRWFRPQTELALCGSGTLAAAHVLCESGDPAETLVFKTCAGMRTLHEAGIEVMLDVVYNHTAEGNHMGPTLSMRGIDNAAYYRLVDDDKRYYMDYTGTGNSLNVGHPHSLHLVTAYPGELDEITAGALVGAFVGAVSGAVQAMIDAGGLTDTETLHTAVWQAARTALGPWQTSDERRARARSDGN